MFTSNPTGRADQSLRNYRFSSRTAYEYRETCSVNAARGCCSSDEAGIQGYMRTPLRGSASDMDWDTSNLDQDGRTDWRIDICRAQSHYRKKKKTRHLLARNWLCCTAFLMKRTSAEDSPPPFRLIHSNRLGTPWAITAWNLQLILLNMFPHTNPQMLSEEIQSKMLNRTLERNSRPSLCRTATASPVSAAILFQPGSALQSVFFSQVELNTFFSCLFTRHFGRCCGFSDIIICFCIAWCMSQH